MTIRGTVSDLHALLADQRLSIDFEQNGSVNIGPIAELPERGLVMVSHVKGTAPETKRRPMNRPHLDEPAANPLNSVCYM